MIYSIFNLFLSVFGVCLPIFTDEVPPPQSTLDNCEEVLMVSDKVGEQENEETSEMLTNAKVKVVPDYEPSPGIPSGTMGEKEHETTSGISTNRNIPLNTMKNGYVEKSCQQQYRISMLLIYCSFGIQFALHFSYICTQSLEIESTLHPNNGDKSSNFESKGQFEMSKLRLQIAN